MAYVLRGMLHQMPSLGTPIQFSFSRRCKDSM